MIKLTKSLKEIRALVDTQAKDEAIWFRPRYVTEAYLQQRIRDLHKLIKMKTILTINQRGKNGRD